MVGFLSRHHERKPTQWFGEVVARLIYFILANFLAVVILELDENHPCIEFVQ
jgi:hypothetical protein